MAKPALPAPETAALEPKAVSLGTTPYYSYLVTDCSVVSDFSTIRDMKG